ncbi:hypothetical protein AALP_AA1G345400 [Arabis alpina]|uniref:Gnk2-homologous domain-containing protein n=1 Tax=Arabis alpina TaxID=50452 RepID=A0A087HSK5_ARAAL|nr:hypothetical protein AALP_AA1G345400 [Arabis alpina]
MFSSSNISKRLGLVYIFVVLAIQLLHLRTVSSLNTTNAFLHHKCISSQGEYKTGSEYEKNLNQLIHSTSKGNFRNGFEQVSLGEGPDSVTLKYQCRGDTYGPKCRSCYTTALSMLRRKCPRNKGKIIWYDQCLIKISSIGSDGKIDYANNICMTNAKNVSDPDAYWNSFIRFISKLNTKATGYYGNLSNGMYTTGEGMFGTEKVYGMVQCTKDLNSLNCQVCLDWIMTKESRCCYEKQGGRVFSTTCNYRYEVYPFI